MKKILLFLTIFFYMNTSPMGEKKVLALSSIGFLTPGMFCALQAGDDQLQLLNTRDGYVKKALIHSRNCWLKGVPLAVPGIALLRLAEAYNTKETPVWPFAFMASGMFALAGSAYKESLRCQKEFEQTQDNALVEQRDKWRAMSALTMVAGFGFCAPIIVDCE